MFIQDYYTATLGAHYSVTFVQPLPAPSVHTSLDS